MPDYLDDYLAFFICLSLHLPLRDGQNESTASTVTLDTDVIYLHEDGCRSSLDVVSAFNQFNSISLIQAAWPIQEHREIDEQTDESH